MHALDLLTPWITFAAIIIPLRYLERWIHRHLYGVGWLLTQDKERATILYYLILSPGVFLHEFSQWLTAGALKVKTRRIQVWPKPQRDGTLRLDFVQLQKTDRFKSTIIGLVPLGTGIALILFISQNVFNISRLTEALGTGDLVILLAEINRLLSTPDFWLWLYLLFAIGNAMIPTPSDRQNWSVVLIIFAIIAGILLIMGLGEAFLIPALQGPITRALNTLVTAFGTVLFLDVGIVLLLGLLEKGVERITGKQAKYQKRRRKSEPKPLPGGEAPLPPDQAPALITERPLPLPPAPKKQKKVAPPKPKPEPKPITSSAPQRLLSPEPEAEEPKTVHDERPLLRPSSTSDLQYETDDIEDYAPGSAQPPSQSMPDETTEESSDHDDDDLTYEPIEDIA